MKFTSTKIPATACLVVGLFLVPVQGLAAKEVAPTGSRSVTLTMTEVVGAQAAKEASIAFTLDEAMSWELYVPDN